MVPPGPFLSAAARGRRHGLCDGARPPPFSLYPARFDQNASTALLRSLSSPLAVAMKFAAGDRGGTRLCAAGQKRWEVSYLGKVETSPIVSLPQRGRGTALAVDEESTFLMIIFRRFFLRYPAAHNARGFPFLRSFLCASQRNEPKKRAGDTCGFSGSSLSRRAGAAALAGR